MKTIRLSLYFIFISNTLLYSQSIIATFGDHTIPTSEFEYVYKKNNSGKTTYTEEAIRNYLDLFISFKIKVEEAKKLKLDTAASIRQEYEDFRKQLAKSYLVDKNLVDKMIEEAYERMKTELDASHILITLPKDAEPKDTLEAYQKIEKIRKQILDGESFEKMAGLYSQDPSAAYNKGHLGYFTALQMVYPFENAAYATADGGISKPVRTKFGYHIIKINSHRPSQGKVLVAHIMLKSSPSTEDSLKIKNKIDAIYGQLLKGAQWDDLCAQESEDTHTKTNGGKLEWFGVAEIIPSFEETAFALQHIGDISKPTQTPYGWHIIKLLDRKPLESFEKMKTVIKTKVSKDSRFDIHQNEYIAKLKKTYGFKEKSKSVSWILNKTDSTLLQGNWKINNNEPMLEKELFKLLKEKITVKEFADFVTKNQTPKEDISPKTAINSLYTDFVKKKILATEEKQLEKTNQEFSSLLKEYQEGILYFQLMYDKIWSKTMNDTATMRQFYEANKNLYQSKESAEAVIYNLADSSLMKRVQQSKKTGSELEKELNQKKPTNASITQGLFEKGENKFLNLVEWKPGKHTTVYNGRYLYIHIKNILAPHPKNFYDVKAQVASDLQKSEEEKFSRALLKQYTIQINEKEIKRLVSN